MVKLEDVPTCVKDDALTLLCLDLLGSGLSRQVYTCTLGPEKWVVKVEVGADGYFQNVREHAVWEAVRHAPALKRWFAPVVNISDLGRFLVQERTQPIRIEDLRRRLPKVPAFFSDLKAANWGWLGSRIVCHDYGTALTAEQGLTTRMRKADWW